MSGESDYHERGRALLLAAVMIVSVVAVGSVGLSGSVAAQNNVHTVAEDGSGDFETIKAALGNVSQGDTIKVEPGTYAGDLTIDTADVTLISNKTHEATITFSPDSPTSSATVDVEASGVTVSGFEVERNASVDRKTDQSGNHAQGIVVRNDDVVIENNVIVNNGNQDAVNFDGLLVLDSSSGSTDNVTFRDNQVSGFYGGIVVTTFYTSGVNDVTLENNSASNNVHGFVAKTHSSGTEVTNVGGSANDFTGNSEESIYFPETGETYQNYDDINAVDTKEINLDGPIHVEDGDSIQTAIDAGGSDTVISVGAGDYNESIQIGEAGGINNVSIQGAGTGKSIISATDDTRAIEIGRVDGQNVAASNISISGFTIKQNTSSSFAIETTTGAFDGVHENITIEKNKIVANGSNDGVGVYLPSAEDVLITNNEFTVEGNGAARELLAIAQSSTEITVKGNSFAGDLNRSEQEFGGNALEIRANNVTVRDNDFSKASSNDGAIIFVSGDNATIDNNNLVGDYTLSDGTTARSKSYAIETDTSLSGLKITQNDISKFRGGIQLYQETVNGATIRGNTIKDVFFGIGQKGNDGTHIVDNQISAQVQGISGWKTNNLLVEDNTITINNSTVGEGNLGNWGQERGVDISGDNATVTGNNISSTDTAVLVQSGNAEVEVTRNNLDGDEYGVDASGYGHTLDATENWWGKTDDGVTGPNAVDGNDVKGDVEYDPFLTTPIENLEVDDAENTTQFANDLVVANDTATAVGFPGPTDQTVGEAFPNFNGTIYEWDGDSWSSVKDGSREIDTLEAFVVVSTEGQIVVNVAYADSDVAAPADTTLEQGYNFVAPATQADASATDTFNLQSGETLYNLYEEPDSSIANNEFDGVSSSPSGDVSPFMGYFVHVDDGDRSHNAIVTTGVTAGEIRSDLNVTAS